MMYFLSMINIWENYLFRQIWHFAGKYRRLADPLRALTTLYYRNADLADLRKLYQHGYHDQYERDKSKELLIKSTQARAIAQTFPQFKKILVGGCADGLLVEELVKQGVDAFGFDISKPAISKAVPEISARIEEGSMTSIPFDASDKFDLFIAVDVIEHIPANMIPSALSELRRLNIDTLALVINHFDLQCLGHVTMRPLSWWRKTMRPHYTLQEGSGLNTQGLPKVYSLGEDAYSQFTIWKAEQQATD